MSEQAPSEPGNDEQGPAPCDPEGARRDAEREADAERRHLGILGEDGDASRRGPTS